MLRDQNVVYYPEELSLLGHALDQAVASLPTVMRTPYNRAEIAREHFGLCSYWRARPDRA